MTYVCDEEVESDPNYRGARTRALLVACGFGLVLLGMAIAPMIVAGHTVDTEPPAVAIPPSRPSVPSFAELELRRVIDLRVMAAASGDLNQLADAADALERNLPGLEGIAHAAAENELGLVQRLLGQEQQDTNRIGQSIAHYRSALAAFEAAGAEETAATVRWNLAIALQLHGELAKSNQSLRESAALLRDLIANGDPALDRRAANRNLGLILLTLGEAENGIRALADSVIALKAALRGADTDNRDRVEWAETQNALATALQALGEREWSIERLEAALKARRNAWVLYQSAGLDTYRFYFDTRIAALEQLIAARRATPIASAEPAT